MSRAMLPKPIFPGSLLLAAVAGCVPAPVETPPVAPPVVSRPAEPEARSVAPVVTVPEDATARDRKFAEFLRGHTGGMIKNAAVGIDTRGALRVELDRSVAPDDTLPLTKSLLAGARKDFPDKPFTLSVFDPHGSPILRAHYKPGQGVDYQIAHGETSVSREASASPDRTANPAPSRTSDALTKSGVTDADRKFASWAEEHGKSYIRYVEADLERHGRLWFGVSREVKPADVPALTKSLLEGARKEFPNGELVANVFDPEGERIGRAHLAANGKVTWEH